MKPTIDPTISIGSLLTLLGLLGAGSWAFTDLSKDVAVLKYQVADLRTEIKLSNTTQNVMTKDVNFIMETKHGHQKAY